jgi:hypothetical protein
MGVNKKGGLVGGFDQLRAPDAPAISVAAGGESVVVTITNPTNTGGGDITGYAVSALTGPIEDTTFAVTVVDLGNNRYVIDGAYTGNTRGLFAGGSGTANNVIQYVDIPSTGNTTDFGDLSANNYGLSAFASSVRGVFSGGSPDGGSYIDTIEYVNIASTGNVTDFGNLTLARWLGTATSNGTRGLTIGGDTGVSGTSGSDVIDYVTIASAGNATDFGDLASTIQEMASTASSTRGVIGGGKPAGSIINVIQYVTIASTGNTTDFGDLSVTRRDKANGNISSGTRGIFAGGTDGSPSNVIDYITIASTGNATDFGDLTAARNYSGCCSSTTRGLIGGGYTASSSSNIIDYITTASTGNATDFGDLDRNLWALAGCSNVHGGIA